MGLDLSLDESLPAPRQPSSKPPGSNTAATTSATTTGEDQPQPPAARLTASMSYPESGSALDAILQPNTQLRAVMEVQISQLHNTMIAIRRLEELAVQMESQRLEQSKMLIELSRAKQEQGDLMQRLTLGMSSAADADSKRVDSALQRLAQAQAALKAAADTISGAGQTFAAHTTTSMQAVEEKLITIVQGQINTLAQITGPVKWGLFAVIVLLLLDIYLKVR